MTIIWVNKRNWKHEGPIVHMALLNAHSFTNLGIHSHFVVGAGDDSSTEDDLIDHYGLQPHPLLAIHRIPRGKQGDKKTSSQPIFRYATRLARQLRQSQNVIVVSRDSGFLPTMARLCRYKKIHAYYELHDFYARQNWKEQVRFRDRREQVLEWLFLRSINGIICITEEMRKLYDQVFPGIQKITVPLGTSPFPKQEINKLRQKRTVFYVGHLQGKKGFSTILDIALPLKERGIHLVCLGGYPNAVNRLRANLKEKGLSDAIEIIPFQGPAGMHRQLDERASLGLSLLEDDFYNRNLTCPVKVLDYLSHGIPVLATALPSNRELLDQAGIYTDSSLVSSIIDQISNLLDDENLYASAVEASRARCQKLTWGTRALKLAEFFKTNHQLIPEAAFGRRTVSPKSDT